LANHDAQPEPPAFGDTDANDFHFRREITQQGFCTGMQAQRGSDQINQRGGGLQLHAGGFATNNPRLAEVDPDSPWLSVPGWPGAASASRTEDPKCRAGRQPELRPVRGSEQDLGPSQCNSHPAQQWTASSARLGRDRAGARYRSPRGSGNSEDSAGTARNAVNWEPRREIPRTSTRES